MAALDSSGHSPSPIGNPRNYEKSSAANGATRGWLASRPGDPPASVKSREPTMCATMNRLMISRNACEAVRIRWNPSRNKNPLRTSDFSRFLRGSSNGQSRS